MFTRLLYTPGLCPECCKSPQESPGPGSPAGDYEPRPAVEHTSPCEIGWEPRATLTSAVSPADTAIQTH